MKFKPFSKKYDFNKDVLEEAFPPYFGTAISGWIFRIVDEYNLGFNHHTYAFGNNTPTALKPEIWSDIKTTLRHDMPQVLDELYPYLFSNQELLIEFLSLLLQNYALSTDAALLERHLSQGGSAYRVAQDGSNYILEKRVPEVIKQRSQKALSGSTVLQEAWKNCYKHNPDYEKAVRSSVDFIEGYFRDKCWPEEERTRTIYAIIKYFEKNIEKLQFKGSTFLQKPGHLIELLEGVSNIRGEHTTGTGRMPTKDEAEYILHTAIYIWNLMEK